MRLSAYSLDTFVAPHLSKLSSARVPDLDKCTDQYCHWVNNYILNTIFRVSPESRNRQLTLYFLRKVEGAFQEYHQGRNFLASYIHKPEGEISSYFRALRHFETTLLLTYHAYDTIRSITHEKLFGKCDGSAIQRLNNLQNISKHANQALGRGAIPDNLSNPIWLTNTGVESFDAILSFTELSDLLKELAETSEELSNPPVSNEEYKNV